VDILEHRKYGIAIILFDSKSTIRGADKEKEKENSLWIS